jgi:hypothetical protein
MQCPHRVDDRALRAVRAGGPAVDRLDIIVERIVKRIEKSERLFGSISSLIQYRLFQQLGLRVLSPRQCLAKQDALARAGRSSQTRRVQVILMPLAKCEPAACIGLATGYLRVTSRPPKSVPLFTALPIMGLMLTRRTFLQLMGASGVALSGSELLSQAVATAAPARFPHGSQGVEHVVILMMENRSFDHFLGWLPGADGRHDLTFLSTDGNFYPNYPLSPFPPRRPAATTASPATWSTRSPDQAGQLVREWSALAGNSRTKNANTLSGAPRCGADVVAVLGCRAAAPNRVVGALLLSRVRDRERGSCDRSACVSSVNSTSARGRRYADYRRLSSSCLSPR